jgi:hypothetical protein
MIAAPALAAELAPRDAMEHTQAEAVSEPTVNAEGVAMFDAPAQQPVAIRQPSATSEQIDALAPSAPAIETSPPAETPVPVKPVVSRPHNLPDIPPVSLELPPDSGLVLIETQHRSAPVIDEPVEPRPKRVRPPRVAAPDEPLQMVETRKENAPPAA